MTRARLIGLLVLAAAFAPQTMAQQAHMRRASSPPPVLGPWERYGGAPSGIEVRPAIIPPAFRGEWNDPAKDCGTDHSDMRLQISAKSIQFYESNGEVRRVIRHNGRAITVLASYSGEGQVWDRVDRLVSSGSGNELTIHTGKDSATRSRCPVKRVRS